jgi:DMSO/TMAO reductase YedYZ molybdopterin-dependent catalytic subunit
MPALAVIGALLATLFAAALAGCAPAGDTMTSRDPGGPIELDGVEVDEYQGEKLGSVEDFRENSIDGPQYVDIDSYHLSITGMVNDERELTYDEVIDRQTYEKVVTLNCVEGWSVKVLWEGVLITDLLDEAGVDADANTLIFHAADGYSTSLPLDFFHDSEILLAYRMNGVTIPPERGYPFQVVAEDKWGYKWCKWVEEIEVSDDEDYRGYWESRGYNNEAEAGGPAFE